MKAYKRWISTILVMSVPISVGCKKGNDGEGGKGYAAVGDRSNDRLTEWTLSEGTVGDERLVWLARCPGDGIADVTSVNGNVYVHRYIWGDDGNKVTHYLDGLDRKTGGFIWSYESGYFKGPPAAGDGKVFVGKTTAVYCLDAATGDRLWDFETPPVKEEGDGIEPVFYDGKVYFGNSRKTEDYVYCLDAETGELVWKDGLGSSIYNIGRTVAADGRIYVEGSEATEDMWPARYIYCLDPETGAHIWRANRLLFDYKEVLVAGGYLYYLEVGQMGSGDTVCMDARTGNLVTRIDNEQPIAGAVGGRLYVVSIDAAGGNDNGNVLRCLDAANAEVLWDRNIGTGEATCFDGAEVYVAFGKKDETGLYCLDAASGKEKWVYKTSDVVEPGNVFVRGDLIYAATEDGNLYCLSKD